MARKVIVELIGEHSDIQDYLDDTENYSVCERIISDEKCSELLDTDLYYLGLPVLISKKDLKNDLDSITIYILANKNTSKVFQSLPECEYYEFNDDNKSYFATELFYDSRVRVYYEGGLNAMLTLDGQILNKTSLAKYFSEYRKALAN